MAIFRRRHQGLPTRTFRFDGGNGFSLAFLFALIGLAVLNAGTQLRAQDQGQDQGQPGKAVVLHIDGAIGPATFSYIGKGLDEAAQENAAVVILRMDTPGGLDTAMRDIIRDILASPVPVISYVAPSGARAASAGTYILYASHVAAMAPGTNLGAATPVQLGGDGGSPLPGGGGEDGGRGNGETGENGNGEDEAAPDDEAAGRAKAVNDAVAYIRSLAELRGRNADWAEQAVRQAASLPARRAVDENVADFMADNLGDVLEQADGRTVTAGGVDVTLETQDIEIEHTRPDWRDQFLGAITDPNVALILMMIGVYGLIFEFMSPGAIYPGAVGGICLIIGLYALNALPVNYAGLALMILGIGLMVGEAFAPSFGVLGLSGIAAFILGAIILMDTEAPGFRLAWPAIAGVAGMSLLFTFLVVPFAVHAQRRKVVSGREELVGAQGVVQDWQGGQGYIFIHGESWRARSDRSLAPKQAVRVTAMNGLTLTVEPVTESPGSDTN